MTGPGNGHPFRQVISGLVKEQIRAAKVAAEYAGLKDDFLAALTSIDHRLTTDPWNFGELKQDLAYAHLKVHVGVVRPLVVEFGIHTELPLVFLRRINLLLPG